MLTSRARVILLMVAVLFSGAPGVRGSLLLTQGGSVEARFGSRWRPPGDERRTLLAELRLQWDGLLLLDALDAEWRIDLLADGIAGIQPPAWQEGGGWLEVREAGLTWRPLFFVDVHLGRRVLSWGSGDLVFINDLFPKDFSAWAVGRAQDRLYAPVDAAQVRIYPGEYALDLVYMPRFHPDRATAGERFSDAPAPRAPAGRTRVFTEDEWAWRMRWERAQTLWTVYGYRGYWKQPEGFDRLRRRPYHPRLAVYGASAETAWWGGRAAAETGYYHTREADRSDRITPQDEVRWLLRYRRPLSPQWTAGVQYDARILRAEAACVEQEPESTRAAAARYRFGLGSRLVWEETPGGKTFTLVARYSPAPRHGILRTEFTQPVHTAWTLTAGSVLILGTHEYPAYRITERDSHLFLALQRSW